MGDVGGGTRRQQKGGEAEYWGQLMWGNESAEVRGHNTRIAEKSVEMKTSPIPKMNVMKKTELPSVKSRRRMKRECVKW